MSDWELVVGVETHVQLRTRTKLFCGCEVAFGAPPNSRTCPVCLGLPGSLPVLNRRALELAVRAALALQAEIQPRTKFDRKHYFYPDLPKNYQISQYDLPFSKGGHVEFEVGDQVRRVRLVRAHLEEDAGKLIHDEARGRSQVDLNRAGAPLVEIVTEPDMRSSEEVFEYMTALKSLMRAAGVSECDMEKGELRCDVNLSVRPRGADALGVKTEVKNLNSFRFAQKAVEYEFARQVKVLESGGRVHQETRLFDSERNVTEVMRSKEEAHDYRYFPEPDLLPLELTAEFVGRMRAEVPERPLERKRRFVESHGLSAYDAGVLTAERETADYFEEAAHASGDAKAAANWITNELSRLANAKGTTVSAFGVPAAELAALIGMVKANRVTGAAAKAVLDGIAAEGKGAEQVVRERGLEAVSDEGAIETLAKEAVAENPKVVADFKGGKATSLQFLVGQVMKKSRGKANPQVAKQVLERLLA